MSGDVHDGGPPDLETTRVLAYRYYREALAEKNRRPNPLR
jgi:hypothetical protein